MKKPRKRPHGGRRPGAGRPRIYGALAHPTSVWLEVEQLVRLDNRADKMGITRSAALKQAVAQWLEQPFSQQET